MSASTSTSTSALPTLRQSLRQLPRAVGTAGPQLPASALPTLRQSLRQIPRAVGTAGPQLLASALPTLCQSLRQLPRAVGTAGPQLRLRPCQLFANLFANFRAQWELLGLNCRLRPCQLVANLFANFRAQWAPLDLNCRLPIWVGKAGPQLQGSERSGHRWTSIRDLPSPAGTAGPQPGTFRAQRAPLDLNGLENYILRCFFLSVYYLTSEYPTHMTGRVKWQLSKNGMCGSSPKWFITHVFRVNPTGGVFHVNIWAL